MYLRSSLAADPGIPPGEAVTPANGCEPGTRWWETATVTWA